MAETLYKVVKFHEFSDMCPNLGREGRDPGQLGQLSPFIGLFVTFCHAAETSEYFSHFYCYL